MLLRHLYTTEWRKVEVAGCKVELHLTAPGSVNNLIVRSQDVRHLPNLPSAHVELTVQTAGLNFRDVLNMLDLDPTRTIRPIGLECASVMRAAGERVAHMRCGNSMSGMAIGCLASIVCTDARLQVRMPPALSFAEACTLPILWCTIRLALAECMQLIAKPCILIHAATGGVGLVALELAQHIGAAVSGSVGRANKASHVRTLGVVAVATSRDAGPFVYGAASCLAGRRLYAALSALTKAFIPTSLAILNGASRYLEVGKNNVWSEARMAMAVCCSPFRLVAADCQTVEWTNARLSELSERVHVGEVHPLPLSVFRFDTAEMVRAFNQLRRGDHIGRYVAMIAAPLSTCATQLTLSGASTSDKTLESKLEQALQRLNHVPTQCLTACLPQNNNLPASSLEAGVLAIGVPDEHRYERMGEVGTLVRLSVDAATAMLQLSDPVPICATLPNPMLRRAQPPYYCPTRCNRVPNPMLLPNPMERCAQPHAAVCPILRRRCAP